MSTVILESGVYTPTTSNLVNVDSVTPYEFQYLRVGDTVNVSGLISIDPTTATTGTSVQINLPVASNVGSVGDVIGVGTYIGVSTMNTSQIVGVTANDTAKIGFVSLGTGAETHSVVFTYQVI